MKQFTIIGLIAALAVVAVISGGYTKSESEPKPDHAVGKSIIEGTLPQVVRPIDLQQEFSFAGEVLPMDNFDVRERLDRELLRNAYYHSNTVLLLKRMQRHFPIIEPILQEEGIPDDFKYLAIAESDLTNATSPAGAKGFWQFLKGTARDYGLEINSEVDERFHLEKATRAACKMIKKLHDRFDSWALAAAAYNMGPNGLSNELETQRMRSYYDLNLNQETSRYVFRIVAIKAIVEAPEAFGFQIDEVARYRPLTSYNTITVDKAIPNLGDFALKYGTTYRMIKIFNPWLLKSSLNNAASKSYDIRIPKDNG